MESMSTFPSPTKSCSSTSTPTESVVVTNKSFLERDNGASELFYGSKLANSLDLLLQKISHHALEVDPKDRDRLNRKCFAPGNPEPEFEESVTSTQSFQYLSSLVEGLRADPRGRSHVVDHYPSPFSEDSFWLSLPKWQAMLGNDDINWSIVTMRSIDRSTFRECFYGWDVKHVHGTALVTNKSSQSNSTHALFSDQPRMVAHHGRSMGKDPEVELVIRVFRCAPRASLRDGIATVLAQDCPNTVFDLWIRHHEVPDLVDGFGHFQHDLGSDVTLLQLLTDVNHSPSPMCLQPTTPPQVVKVGPSPPPRPHGRPTAPLPRHIAPFPSLQGDQDASYNADLDTSIDSEYRETTPPTPSPPIPCADILPNALTIAIPRPIQVWSTSPISPALATAASSDLSALDSADDIGAFPIFDDGSWPNLRPLPDPILVRVLTEDMDMAVGRNADMRKYFGKSSTKGEILHDSLSFPEDFVGGHHRMYHSMATKTALAVTQRRKKKDKQEWQSVKKKKAGVSNAAAAAIADENTPPMRSEYGATFGNVQGTGRGGSHGILRPTNTNETQSIHSLKAKQNSSCY